MLPPEPSQPERNPYEPPRTVAKSSPGTAEIVIRLLKRIGLTFLVGLACVIAFVASCLPVGGGLVFLGFFGENYNFLPALIPACIVGLTAAIWTGVVLVRQIKKQASKAP